MNTNSAVFNHGDTLAEHLGEHHGDHPGDADLALLSAKAERPVQAGAKQPELPRLAQRFARLGSGFFSPCAATPLPAPTCIASSSACATLLGWQEQDFRCAPWPEILAGNQLLPGSSPLAAVYSGHQFGVWAGQLGDGRALLLGNTDAPGRAFEVQLKGAGPTPYSRMGDGRAVLRSSIREFLCSEAMAALGVPTTRALALVASPLPVMRERVESAAVVTRVAASFVRFGSFEHWAARGDEAHLQALADFVIQHHFPALRAQPAPYLALLEEVIASSAQLVAHWQSIGFCHGVLNTDNMSILGLTLDYGPFGFLEAFDAAHICNHSDQQGRYAYAMQPKAVQWNLYCLGQSLLPLIGSVEATEAALQRFGALYDRAFDERMNAKLGLTHWRSEDRALIDDWFQLLQANHADFTTVSRRLSRIRRDKEDHDALWLDSFADRQAAQSWLARYRLRLIHESLSDEERQACMDRVNPKYVLRNYLAENAIQAAQAGDFALIGRLLDVLSRPFDEQAEAESFAQPAPAWAAQLEVSCSS